MAASYPTSVKTFTTKATNDTIEASHVNDIQDEVNAIEDALLNGFVHVLKPTSTNTRDLGTSALFWRTAYLRTSLVLGQTTGNYTVQWNDPAASRVLTVPDPGGADSFVFLAATQTLTNKTLTSPVLGGTITGTYTVGGTPTVAADLLFTDATYDIGKSGLTRPRDLFLSRNAVVGGTLDVTGVATLTATPNINAGLQFPAAQAASANVNVLDDYEEGSWTPTIISSGGGSGAYTTQTGRYVKIGKMVWVAADVRLSSKTGYTAGTVQFGGLPFTSDATQVTAVAVGFFAAMTTAIVNIYAHIVSSSTVADVYMLTAAATNATAMSISDLSDTSRFIWAACYRASA